MCCDTRIPRSWYQPTSGYHANPGCVTLGKHKPVDTHDNTHDNAVDDAAADRAAGGVSCEHGEQRQQLCTEKQHR